MSAFDFFITLDGNCLNGFEGLCGIARLRCDPDADHWEQEVHFFEGLAGGHATQVNPTGTLGFLGNLSQTLLFYDPRTLQEVRRLSTLRFCAPDVIYSSQTHVVWLSETSFITVLGDSFWRFDMDDLENPERLGKHRVKLPHALKLSPSGRYLGYGSMDHDHKGYARELGIFDLEDNTARVVELPATCWHIASHPTKDFFYGPSQQVAPQGSEFGEYTLAHFKNYVFEVDAESATVTRHAAIAKELPAAFTSDVAVTPDHVFYNACAGGTLVQVDLETFKRVRFIDERPSFLQTLPHLRSGVSNLVEAFSRANVLGNSHLLLKALRATRFSLLDGSLGVQVSPDRRFVLTAHRGLNEVIVYRHPEMTVHKRIRFPSIRGFFPEHIGPLSDQRLGFHHTTISTASVNA
jgi:hypothetical protein